MCISPSLWGAQNWTQHFRCGLTSAEEGGRIPSLHLLGSTPHSATQATISLLCGKAILLAHVQLGPPGPPGPFLPNSFPARQTPACTDSCGCSSPGAGLRNSTC